MSGYVCALVCGPRIRVTCRDCAPASQSFSGGSRRGTPSFSRALRGFDRAPGCGVVQRPNFRGAYATLVFSDAICDCGQACNPRTNCCTSAVQSRHKRGISFRDSAYGRSFSLRRQRPGLVARSQCDPPRNPRPGSCCSRCHVAWCKASQSTGVLRYLAGLAERHCLRATPVARHACATRNTPPGASPVAPSDGDNAFLWLGVGAFGQRTFFHSGKREGR